MLHIEIRDAQSDYGFSDLPVVIEIVEKAERIETLFVRARRAARLDSGNRRASPSVSRFDQGVTMIIEGTAQKVTVYIGSQGSLSWPESRCRNRRRCRELGLAGATMTRGIMGFGKNSRIHQAPSSRPLG